MYLSSRRLLIWAPQIPRSMLEQTPVDGASAGLCASDGVCVQLAGGNVDIAFQKPRLGNLDRHSAYRTHSLQDSRELRFGSMMFTEVKFLIRYPRCDSPPARFSWDWCVVPLPACNGFPHSHLPSPSRWAWLALFTLQDNVKSGRDQIRQKLGRVPVEQLLGQMTLSQQMPEEPEEEEQGAHQMPQVPVREAGDECQVTFSISFFCIQGRWIEPVVRSNPDTLGAPGSCL